MATPQVTPQQSQAQVDPLTQAIGSTGLSDAEKEQLWDALHGAIEAGNDYQLTKALQNTRLDDGTKEKLYDLAYDRFPVPQKPTQVDVSTGNTDYTASDLARDASNFTEDLTYPGVGAAVGAALTAPAELGGPELGVPAQMAGAALGGMAGRGIENLVRRNTGRGDLTPQTLPEEALDLTLAGAGGAMQEGGAIFGRTLAAKSADAMEAAAREGLQQTANEFKVPLSPGQKFGGGTAWLENFLRKAGGSREIIAEKYDRPANDAIIEAGKDLVDKVSQSKFANQADAGEFLAEGIRQAKNVAGLAYGAALEQIGLSGADRRLLNVTGDMRLKAQELVERLTRNDDFTDAVSSPARQKVIQTLQQFADPFELVETGLMDKNGNPIVTRRLKQLTWGDARKLKQDLDELIWNGEMTSQKETLSEFRYALNREMKAALGNTPEAIQFQRATDHYAATQDLLDKAIIQRLLDNEKPELAAHYLLSGGAGESNAATLKQLIGPKYIDVMKGAVLDEMLTKAMNPSAEEGTLVGTTLLKQWNKLGEEAQTAIFGQNRDQIARFVKLADAVTPKGAGIINMVSQGALGASIYGAGKALMTLNPKGALLSLGSGAAIYVTPRMLAKLLVTADGAGTLNRALTTHVGERSARWVASKLFYLVDSVTHGDDKLQFVNDDSQ